MAMFFVMIRGAALNSVDSVRLQVRDKAIVVNQTTLAVNQTDHKVTNMTDLHLNGTNGTLTTEVLVTSSDPSSSVRISVAAGAVMLALLACIGSLASF